MRKLIPLLLGIVLVGAGIGAVQLISPGLDADASPSGSVAGTTTSQTVEDRPETTTTVETVRRTTTAVDVSGPCDEAEHANDPRCTGGPQAAADDDRRGRGGDDDRDDRSGRGRGGSDNDDDSDDDDRSGSNSGRG